MTLRRVQIVVPPLPTLLASPEISLIRSEKELFGYLVPAIFDIAFAESHKNYLRIEVSRTSSSYDHFTVFSLSFFRLLY